MKLTEKQFLNILKCVVIKGQQVGVNKINEKVNIPLSIKQARLFNLLDLDPKESSKNQLEYYMSLNKKQLILHKNALKNILNGIKYMEKKEDLIKYLFELLQKLL